MKSKSQTFIVMIIACTVLFSGCDLSIKEPETTGTITGKVTFSNSSSHADIIISLESRTDDIPRSVSRALSSDSFSTATRALERQTTTSVDGEYILNGIPEGEYTLYASSKDSSEQAVYTAITVEKGRTLRAPDLQLTAVGSIRGRILLNGSVRGNIGFIVFIADTSYMAITGDEGNFTISRVPSGTNYSLIIMRGTDTYYWDNVAVNAGEITQLGMKTILSENFPGIISITWKGSLAGAPESPGLYWTYYNSTDGNSYIFNGNGWDLLARAGSDGATGATGPAGADGLSIVWKGELASAPENPLVNWAYYNSVDGKSYVYSGTGWGILAQDGKDPISVQYDGNGALSGEVPVSKTFYRFGESIEVAQNAGGFTLPGFTFIGWNTQPDGMGDSYDAGETLSASIVNTVFYAMWSRNTYTLEYNVNHEDVQGSIPKQNILFDTEYILADASALSLTGYIFMGWNTETDGSGFTYLPGDIRIAGIGDFEVFAQWEKKEITVTFFGNGADGGDCPNPIVTEYMTAITLPDQETLVRLHFLPSHWNTEMDGSGIDYQFGETITVGALPLNVYMQWNPINYTISFNGNGSTDGQSPDALSTTCLDSVTIPDNNSIKKDGCYFGGWNSAADYSGIRYFPGEEAVFTSNSNLYAIWLRSIRYDVNGATTGMGPSDVHTLPGSTYLVESQSNLEKKGHQFIGWNTAADGSGATHNPTDEIIIPDENIVLFAQWEPLTYSIQFIDEFHTEGEPAQALSVPFGTEFVFPTNGTMCFPGYVFDGWSLQPDGSSQHFMGGETYLVGESNLIFYGTWAPATYTVSYNGNGATGGNVPQTVTLKAGEKIFTATPSLTRNGYDFNGWNTAANGSGVSHAIGSQFTMSNQDIILYAQWRAKTYYLYYNKNGGSGSTRSFESGTIGSSVTVRDDGSGLYKSGKYFLGWNTRNDGKGDWYNCQIWFEDKNRITFGASDITLFAQWSDYSINGNHLSGPAGGTVFYDKGYDSDGWRYLEAAPAGWSGSYSDPLVTWGPDNLPTNVKATAIGTGESNTEKITRAFAGNQHAAHRANNLVRGGYSDWFLPSVNEASQMYYYLGYLGLNRDGFDAQYYWTSSETNAQYAKAIEFKYSGLYSPNASISALKSTSNMVGLRPIRAFSPTDLPPAQLQRPTLSPASGTYSDSVSVQVSSMDSSVSLYYTTDGTLPSPSNGISISNGSTLRFTNTTSLRVGVFKSGYAESYANADYQIVVTPEKVSRPTVSSTTNSFYDEASVTISCDTPGASIKYTINDTRDIATYGTSIASGSTITITDTSTIRAKAFKNGMDDSEIQSATFFYMNDDIVSGARTLQFNGDTASINGYFKPRNGHNLDMDLYFFELDSDAHLSFAVNQTPFYIFVYPNSSLTEALLFETNNAEEINVRDVPPGRYYIDLKGASGPYTLSVTKEAYDAPRVGAIGPGGGIVFYDKGYYSDGWRYMEVAYQGHIIKEGLSAPVSDPKFRWAPDSKNIESLSESIGSGRENTQVLRDELYWTSQEYAAEFCYDFKHNNFDDWFLPSIDELKALQKCFPAIDAGGFSGGWYWSSSSIDPLPGKAIAIILTGEEYYAQPDSTYYWGYNHELLVRPIRYF